MTPTIPPAIPSDIPADLMAIADNIARDLPTAGARHFDKARATIARALLAAQERGKLMERERCAGIADEQIAREEYGHAKHAAVIIAQNIREAN